MSVLVKGVQMPKNCNACKFEKGCAWCGLTGGYTLGNRLKTRLDDCPLVEAPVVKNIYDVFADEYIAEEDMDINAPPERYKNADVDLIIKNAARWIVEEMMRE